MPKGTEHCRLFIYFIIQTCNISGSDFRFDVLDFEIRKLDIYWEFWICGRPMAKCMVDVYIWFYVFDFELGGIKHYVCASGRISFNICGQIITSQNWKCTGMCIFICCSLERYDEVLLIAQIWTSGKL